MQVRRRGAVTLAEFITARLGEDERWAHEWQKIRDDWVEVRVLREVAAKRAILAEHAPGYPTTYPKPSGQPTCGVCHAGGFEWEPEKWPCATVRALGAVWSDHPDWREWKP